MISFLLCAFNEEKNIKPTIDKIYESINNIKFIDNFEIIIVNDGSEDSTEKVILDLKSKDKNIIYCKNEKNLGLGKSIQKGLKYIKYPKFMVIPADNAMPTKTITLGLKHYNSADLVMIFPINSEYRSKFRNAFSIIFRLIYAIFFDCYVLYVNAPFIAPTEKVKNFKLFSVRLSVISEIVTKLLHSNITYCEIPAFYDDSAKKRKTVIFKNLLDVISSFFKLFIELKISNKNKFSKKSQRKNIH